MTGPHPIIKNLQSLTAIAKSLGKEIVILLQWKCEAIVIGGLSVMHFQKGKWIELLIVSVVAGSHLI